MSGIPTRQSHTCPCPIIGEATALDENKLPTHRDVLKACFLERIQRTESRKEPKWKVINEAVCVQIEAIWKKGSLPHVSTRRIVAMLDSLHARYKNIQKSYTRDKDKTSYMNKIEIFRSEIDRLFDVCTCKCSNDKCKCPSESRIPKLEAKFIDDQRNKRLMIIGNTDKATTSRNLKIYARKQKLVKKLEPSSPHDSAETSEIYATSSSSDMEEKSDKEEFHYDSQDRRNIKKVNLSSFSLACDRTGVSDRAASIIASSVLADFGVINEDDQSEVIDRSKVRRQRTISRSNLINENNKMETVIECIFFDGKKDDCLSMIKKGSKHSKSIVEEEHYTILE